MPTYRQKCMICAWFSGCMLYPYVGACKSVISTISRNSQENTAAFTLNRQHFNKTPE
jgi:hypothetical protein